MTWTIEPAMIESLPWSHGFLQIVGWVLLATVLQAALLSGALSLVLRLVPRSKCRVRYRASLVAGALLVAVTLGTGGWLLGDWGVHTRCWSGDAEWVRTHGAVCRRHGRAEAGAGEAIPVAAAVDRMIRGGWPQPPPPRVFPGTSRKVTPFLGLLAVIWIGGLVVMAVRTLLDLRALARLRAQSEPVTYRPALEAFEDIGRTLHPPGSVSLRASSSITNPGTAGWRHPLVLLPSGLLSALDARGLRCVVAHELAHASGRDYPVGLIQLVVRRVLFFNPFVGVLCRMIDEEREALRDRMAVSAVGSTRGYAETLLLVEGWRGLARAPSGLVPMADPGGGTLLARIRRLKDPGPTTAPKLRVLLGAIVIALLTAALAHGTVVGGSVGTWAVMSLDGESRAAHQDDSPPLAARTDIDVPRY